MKNLKKVLTIVLALALLVPMLGIGSYAVSCEAGKTVTVNLSVPNAYGINGFITYSNFDIFESLTVADMSDKFSGDVTKDTVYLFGTSLGTYGVKVTAKLKASAKVGDSCTITITGDKAIDDNGNVEPLTISAVITVAKPQPVVTTPVTEPAPALDYTELLDAIADAELLDKVGYTNESWDALQLAVSNGRVAYDTATDQETVDEAAKAIRDAMSKLETVDYTELKKALEEAEKFFEGDELALLIRDLIDAMEIGEAALTSGDQAEIDAATKGIKDALSAVLAALDGEEDPEPTDPEPGEPEGPFCNIEIHKLWPILFIISAVVNVGLIVWIIVILRKKKEDDEGKAA